MTKKGKKKRSKKIGAPITTGAIDEQEEFAKALRERQKRLATPQGQHELEEMLWEERVDKYKKEARERLDRGEKPYEMRPDLTVKEKRERDLAAARAMKEQQMDEIRGEMRQLEKETGRRIWHWVYCNHLEKDKLKDEMRRSGKPGCLVPMYDIQYGKPLILAEEWDPRLTTAEEMQEKYNEKYVAYMRTKMQEPRRAGEVRLPTPFEAQRLIIQDRARFKVLVCGRRFGKTTLALILCVLYATKNRGAVVHYIAPTYRQSKSIAWKTLLDFIGTAYSRKNEQELTIELPNGSRIELKGAENEDSLRGVSCDFVVLDEYGDIKPTVWGEIIRPMLADRGGKAIFIGTPKGYNHFHELFQDVELGKLGDKWKCWRLTTYHNPTIPPSEIEEMKRDMDEREFKQEVMAEFVQFEGLVFSDFNRIRHVKTFDVREIAGIDIVGLDWGADHPTGGAFVRVGGDGKFYVWGEHYLRNAPVIEHAMKMKEKVKRANAVVRKWWLDPSAKQIFEELKRHGIRAKKAVNDRAFGISELRALFRNDQIVVHPDCQNLIYELEHHRYKDRGGRGERRDVDKEVLKVQDDLVDALRYAVASFRRNLNAKGTGYRREDYLPVDLPSAQKLEFDFQNLENNRGRRRRREFKNQPKIAKEFSNL